MTFNFDEKDSCGVGFIASRGIPRTHGMTLKILQCLSNLDHRGAKFADGTGDGAGVLTEIPFELIEAELDDATNQLPEYNANTDALGAIDCAKNELYCLKDDLEKAIITNKQLDPIDRFAD